MLMEELQSRDLLRFLRTEADTSYALFEEYDSFNVL